MSKRRLIGSFVALITPFNQDYSLDFEGFRVLLDFHAENHTSAVLIMGSSGEVSMLTADERHAVVSETLKFRRDGMEMWYGCTGPTTEATIAYVAQAAGEGADGAVIAAPPYICAPNADIVRFFLEVADASAIMTGIPRRASVSMTRTPPPAEAPPHPNV